MYHDFFIHSSVNGHLGCFHVLAIVNGAAMNNGTYVSFSVLVSSGYTPEWDCWVIWWFYFLVLKIWNAWQICISSLCRSHANLLCIIPILEYVQPKQAPPGYFLKTHKVPIRFPWMWLTSFQLLVPYVFFSSYGVTPITFLTMSCLFYKTKFKW